MDMLLAGLALSFLGVVVSAVLFAAATQNERSVEARPELKPMLGHPQFFGEHAAPKVRAIPTQVPIEVLLLQLERHVRLEQAAAESFHMAPTLEALHARTTSPLVH